MSNNALICYSVTVKKQLQTEALTEALNQLMLSSGMLKARLKDGRYILEQEAPHPQNHKLLSVYDCSGETANPIGRIIDALADEIYGKQGPPVQVALIKVDEHFNRLLLLSHSAITDGRGLSLILEELYRAYEQLSNGMEGALHHVRKTCLKTAEEAAAMSGRGISESVISESDDRTEIDQPKPATFSLRLDKKLKQRLFSWRLVEFGLTPKEALIGALLRSLAEESESDPVSVWIKSDYRLADETLKFAIGAFTRTSRVPSDFTEKRELSSNLKKWRGILRDIPLNNPQPDLSQPEPQSSKSSVFDRRLSLNLEYLTDEPWLGGDEWLPEGFVITERGRIMDDYSVEIIPYFLSDGVEIFVPHMATPAVKTLVDGFAANLVPELESILRYCEEYVDAKEFWVREFAKVAGKMKIEEEIDGRGVTTKGRASVERRVEKSVIDRALLNFGTDESQLLLAAYAILVSRLSGGEDIVALCTIDQDDASAVFPLRLNPTWSSTFKLFIEEVKSKFRQAAAFGQYAFDILSEEKSKPGRQHSAPDAGYVCKQAGFKHGGARPPIGLQANSLPLYQEPDLSLEISESADAIDLRFDYEKTRFDVESVNRLGVYLNSIIEDVAANADVRLDEIEFERGRKMDDPASALAKDAFSF